MSIRPLHRLTLAIAAFAGVASSASSNPDQHLDRMKQISRPTTFRFGSITCTEAPTEYPGAEGYVVVRLTLDTSGAVEDVKVSQSSGNSVVDAAALKAAASIKCDPYIAPQTGKAAPVIAKKPYWFKDESSRPAEPTVAPATQ